MTDFDFRRAASHGPVEVTIPAEVAFDIDALFEVQRSIFERMGHPGCYSGADIRFQLERRFVVNPSGRVQGFAAEE